MSRLAKSTIADPKDALAAQLRHIAAMADAALRVDVHGIIDGLLGHVGRHTRPTSGWRNPISLLISSYLLLRLVLVVVSSLESIVVRIDAGAKHTGRTPRFRHNDVDY